MGSSLAAALLPVQARLKVFAEMQHPARGAQADGSTSVGFATHAPLDSVLELLRGVGRFQSSPDDADAASSSPAEGLHGCTLDPATKPRALGAALEKADVRMAAAHKVVLVATAAGQVLGFGRNHDLILGQADDTVPASSPIPIRFPEQTRVVHVAVSARHALALSEQGQLFTWGHGGHGALGHGNRTSLQQPVPVQSLSAHRIMHADCGSHYTAAITDRGQLFTWGSTAKHCTGHETSRGILDLPVALPEFDGTVPGRTASRVACGYGDAQTLVIAMDGSVWSFGDREGGKLGREGSAMPAVIDSLRGIRLVQAVCGASFSAVRSDTGYVYTFGKNHFQQLGASKQNPDQLRPTLVNLGKVEARRLIAGPHTCIVLGAKDEVLAWGQTGGLENDARAEIPPTHLPTLCEAGLTDFCCGLHSNFGWKAPANHEHTTSGSAFRMNGSEPETSALLKILAQVLSLKRDAKVSSMLVEVLGLMKVCVRAASEYAEQPSTTTLLKVKTHLLTLIHSEASEAEVLADALDVLLVGWNSFGGTPEELSRIKAALVAKVTGSAAEADHVAMAERALTLHWRVLMPRAEERIENLVNMLSESLSAEANPTCKPKRAFLVKLLLDTLCSYANFAGSLEALGALLPLVVEYSCSRCSSLLLTQLTRGGAEMARVQYKHEKADADRGRAQREVKQRLTKGSAGSLRAALTALEAAKVKCAQARAELQQLTATQAEANDELVASFRLCTIYQRVVLSRLRYGAHGGGAPVPTTNVIRVYLTTVIQFSVAFLDELRVIVSPAAPAQPALIAHSAVVSSELLQGSPLVLLEELISGLLVLTLPGRNASTRDAHIIRGDVVLPSIKELLLMSTSLEPWNVSSTSIVAAIIAETFGLTRLHSTLIPLLLSRSAALEAGSYLHLATSQMWAGPHDVLSTYRALLAGGRSDADQAIGGPNDCSPNPLPATEAVTIWGALRHDTKTGDMFLKKFVAEARKANFLFQSPAVGPGSRSWEQFAPVVRLLLSAMLKHLDANHEAQSWASADGGLELPERLGIIFRDVIAVHNQLFESRRHTGDQEAFFNGVTTRLIFLIDSIEMAKPAGSGGNPVHNDGNEHSPEAASRVPVRELSAMTWGIDSDCDTVKKGWLSAKLPRGIVSVDEKLIQDVVSFSMDGTESLLDTLSQQLCQRERCSRRARHGCEAFCSLLTMLNNAECGFNSSNGAAISAGWHGVHFPAAITPDAAPSSSYGLDLALEWDSLGSLPLTEQKLFVGMISDLCLYVAQRLRDVVAMLHTQLDSLVQGEVPVAKDATPLRPPTQCDTLQYLRNLCQEIACHLKFLTRCNLPESLNRLAGLGLFQTIRCVRELSLKSSTLAESCLSSVVGRSLRAEAFSELAFPALKPMVAMLEQALVSYVTLADQDDIATQTVDAVCEHLLLTVEHNVECASNHRTWSELLSTLAFVRALSSVDPLGKKFASRRCIALLLGVCQVRESVAARLAAIATLESVLLYSVLLHSKEDNTETLLDVMDHGEENMLVTHTVKRLLALLSATQCPATSSRIVLLLRTLAAESPAWAHGISLRASQIVDDTLRQDPTVSAPESKAKLKPVLLAFGHIQYEIIPGCAVKHATEGHGVVVSASAHNGGAVSEARTLRSSIGPESTHNSYYGVFFDVTAGASAVQIEGVYAGSEGKDDSTGNLYTHHGSFNGTQQNPQLWNKVCDCVTLNKGGAVLTTLPVPIVIDPGATQAFYLHGPSHNETVAYVGSREPVAWQPTTDDLTITPGNYTKSGTPFTRVDSGHRQLAGGLHYSVLADHSLMSHHSSPLTGGCLQPIWCTAFPLGWSGSLAMKSPATYPNDLSGNWLIVARSPGDRAGSMAAEYEYTFNQTADGAVTGHGKPKGSSERPAVKVSGVIADGVFKWTEFVGDEEASRFTAEVSMGATSFSGLGVLLPHERPIEFSATRLAVRTSQMSKVVPLNFTAAPKIDMQLDMRDALQVTTNPHETAIDVVFAHNDGRSRVDVHSVTVASVSGVSKHGTVAWGLIFVLESEAERLGTTRYNTMQTADYDRYRNLRTQRHDEEISSTLPVGQLSRNTKSGLLESTIDFNAVGRLVLIKLFPAADPRGEPRCYNINCVAITGTRLDVPHSSPPSCETTRRGRTHFTEVERVVVEFADGHRSEFKRKDVRSLAFPGAAYTTLPLENMEQHQLRALGKLVPVAMFEQRSIGTTALVPLVSAAQQLASSPEVRKTIAEDPEDHAQILKACASKASQPVPLMDKWLSHGQLEMAIEALEAFDLESAPSVDRSQADGPKIELESLLGAKQSTHHKIHEQTTGPGDAESEPLLQIEYAWYGHDEQPPYFGADVTRELRQKCAHDDGLFLTAFTSVKHIPDVYNCREQEDIPTLQVLFGARADEAAMIAKQAQLNSRCITEHRKKRRELSAGAEITCRERGSSSSTVGLVTTVTETTCTIQVGNSADTYSLDDFSRLSAPSLRSCARPSRVLFLVYTMDGTTTEMTFKDGEPIQIQAVSSLVVSMKSRATGTADRQQGQQAPGSALALALAQQLVALEPSQVDTARSWVLESFAILSARRMLVHWLSLPTESPPMAERVITMLLDILRLARHKGSPMIPADQIRGVLEHAVAFSVHSHRQLLRYIIAEVTRFVNNPTEISYTAAPAEGEDLAALPDSIVLKLPSTKLCSELVSIVAHGNASAHNDQFHELACALARLIMNMGATNNVRQWAASELVHISELGCYRIPDVESLTAHLCMLDDVVNDQDHAESIHGVSSTRIWPAPSKSAAGSAVTHSPARPALTPAEHTLIETIEGILGGAFPRDQVIFAFVKAGRDKDVNRTLDLLLTGNIPAAPYGEMPPPPSAAAAETGSITTVHSEATVAMIIPVLKVCGSHAPGVDGLYGALLDEANPSKEVTFYQLDDGGNVLNGDKLHGLKWSSAEQHWRIFNCNTNADNYVNGDAQAPPTPLCLPPRDGWTDSLADGSPAPSISYIEGMRADICGAGTDASLRVPAAGAQRMWDFASFASASQCSGEITDGGRTVEGRGDWYWCTGPSIPEHCDGTYFYEVEVTARDTADLYFGFGKAGQTSIGDSSNVQGLYYYKSFRNPPKLWPSEVDGPKTSTGDIVRVEYSSAASTILFYRNGEFIGEEHIAEEHSADGIAPYVSVYYRGAKATLVNSGMVGAAPNSEWFGTPRHRGGGVVLPSNDLELFIRRLPVLLDSQWTHEATLRLRGKPLTLYFKELCKLSIRFGQSEIPFNSPSSMWLRQYVQTIRVAQHLASAEPAAGPLPAPFLSKVAATPMYKRWHTRSLSPCPLEAIKYATLGPLLEGDQQLMEWFLHPLRAVDVRAWQGFPAGGRWTHAAFPGKTFVRIEQTGGADDTWECALREWTYSNVMLGGGCGMARSTRKLPTHFKVADAPAPVLCSECMFRLGALVPGTDQAEATAAAHVQSNGGLPALEGLPIAALLCRAAMLTYFVEQGVLHADRLPSLLDAHLPLLSRLGALVPLQAKRKLIMFKISTTMSNSDSNRPRLSLNRLGLIKGPNGLIGPDGTASIFVQVMMQMERREKEIPGLWHRPKRLFKVDRLAGEGVEDAGGAYSDMISTMMEELAVDQSGRSGLPLLAQTPNGREGIGVNRDTLVFNADANLPLHWRMFRFLGILIGVAVRTESPIQLPLALPMWDLLLGRDLMQPGSDSTLSKLCARSKALAELDECSYREIVRVAQLPDKAMPASSTLTFVSATGRELHLGRGEGSNPRTRSDMVRRWLHLRCSEFDQHVEAVRSGIAEVLPIDLLSLLTAREFAEMVCGEPDFDVRTLKAAVRLDGYTTSSDQVIWLWDTLCEFTPSEKSQFLRFVGGFTRLPHDLSKLPHRFEVHRVRGRPNALPTASTCFFTLKLPEYPSLATLRAKLRLAMVACTAIDTDGRGGDFDLLDG